VSSIRRSAIFALVCAFALGLSACAQSTSTHGYTPTEGDLAEIEVGQDTRETVEAIIGRPSATGVLNEQGWFYVKSEFREFGYREPDEIAREVVAVLFEENGIVANVERFGIEDGQVVTLSRRVTDDNTTGVSFLQQLFGNIGNFNPAGFLDGG
jgi:outer membrane protein assembly factor BamE (lipoprotein component of BamABCDE complex)